MRLLDALLDEQSRAIAPFLDALRARDEEVLRLLDGYASDNRPRPS
jgi:hypothetical protein